MIPPSRGPHDRRDVRSGHDDRDVPTGTGEQGPACGEGVSRAAVEQGVGGFVIHGEANDERWLWPISGDGDVNGDGRDDIPIGTPVNADGGGDSENLVAVTASGSGGDGGPTSSWARATAANA